jgi:hypothetical protein
MLCSKFGAVESQNSRLFSEFSVRAEGIGSALLASTWLQLEDARWRQPTISLL